MMKKKATKVAGGYAVKRKARVQHECHGCGCHIEPGEEYYQLTLRSSHCWEGWVTKCICEQCWQGSVLKV